MYEFLDVQGERVTVRSARTLSVLLADGQITAETRFRRAGEPEFGVAGSHPELQGIAAQLGIALAPPAAQGRVDMQSERPRRSPRPVSDASTLDVVIPAMAADAPAPTAAAQVVPVPISPAPATLAPDAPMHMTPGPWAYPGSSPRRAPSAVLDLRLGRFGTVLISLAVSAVAGLIVSALSAATRDGAELAWLIMMVAGVGAAWLAGRRFRTRHVLSWRRDGPALAVFGVGLMLLGGGLGTAFAIAVAFGFTKGARPRP